MPKPVPNLLGRLMRTFVPLSLVVVVLSGVVSWLEVRWETRQAVMQRLTSVVEVKAQELSLWMDEKKQDVAFLAVDSDLLRQVQALSKDPQDAEAADALSARLSTLAAHCPDFSEIFVTEPDASRILASSTMSHTNRRLSSTPFLEAAGSRRFRSTVYREASTGSLILTLGTSVESDGRVLALLGVRADLSRLSSLVGSRTGLDFDGEVRFEDRQEFSLSPKGPAEHRREVLAGYTVTENYPNYEGVIVLGAVKYLDEPGLVLFAESPRFSALAPARRVAGTVMAAGLLLAALMTLGMYYASRRIARPILAVTEAAEAVAHGDLTRKAPVMGRDQIGRLAMTFNWMTDQIQTLYADMREKVTQIQEAKDAIARKERHFRALIENASDLIAVMDSEGRLTYVSPSVSRILGFSPGEVEGSSAFDWFHAEDAKRLREAFPRLMSPERVIRPAEYRVRHKDGGYRVLEMYGTNLLEDPVVHGLIVNARDMTERRKYLEELGRMEKLESIGVMAGGIAHDFNNMLTGILGNVSLARLQAPRDALLAQRLGEAEKAILAARDLTQQLLTFASGGAPLTESASMDALLKESVGFALSGGKVRAQYDLPRNLWPVEVDPGQIRQVIHNVVINAVQAQGGVGAVRIEAENKDVPEDSGLPLTPGRYVVVRISDEGHGIEEKDISRIFDPYFTTKKNGSGLGLAITHQVVARHNGHVSVSSRPGLGATFSIYLPASEDLPVETPQSPAMTLSGRGRRVLVMDDEEAVLDVTAAMLQYLGFSVDKSRDGREAVAMYQTALASGEPYSAVIMDLTVAGGMGGREAMEEIHVIDPKAVGVVSSGYCQDPIMAEYGRHGFSGFIAKPYTPEKLHQVLSKVLKPAAK